MPDSKPIVVDTNILFSALLREGSPFARVMFGSEHAFHICESVIVELFRHKERIVLQSKLADEEVVRLLYILLRQLTVSREDLIEPGVRKEAFQLCKDVDLADTPVVALTIHLNGLLWTGDNRLKTGLHKKGFDAFFQPSH